jgi:hypothetical protein
VSALEATTTIDTPLGEAFTHSAWVEGDTHGVYDVEVGPRLTFRRVKAEDVKVGDVLMDTFGQPTHAVHGVRHTTRTVRLTMSWDSRTFTRGEVLNVFVSSEEVPA